MINIAEPIENNTVVDYTPSHMVKEYRQTRLASQEYTPFKRSTYMNVDAIYHYWVKEGDPDGEEYTTESSAEVSQAEEIAKLIAGKYDRNDYAVNYLEREVELPYTHFRNTTTFMSGHLTDGHVESIVEWLKHHHGDSIVVLDAGHYIDQTESEAKEAGFSSFMKLANNQKRIIKEGVIDLFPSSAKDAIDFLDASPGNEITNCPHGDTKWLAEGRILAWELIKIKEFQKNFDLLVIKNAAQFIHSDRLNLNNIYRLMAKLGRVNTKIVFVG